MKSIYRIIIIFLISISFSFSKDNLNLLYPNGGESLYTGEYNYLFWDGIDIGDSINIEYSTDNGKNWKSAIDKPATMFFEWETPDVESDSCLVRISQLSNDEIGPTIEWEETYGGTSVEQDPYILPTNDGGYVIVSISLSDDGDVEKSNGNMDYWIVKIDSIGKIEWSKVYGGQYSDIGSGIKQTPDGGYIVVGNTSSNDGDVGPRDYLWSDAWVLKLDKNGDIEWKKTYGGSDSDYITDVVLTEDNGYILAGYTSSDDGDVPQNKGSRDIWVLKINRFGTIVWSKTYGGKDMDQTTSMDKTKDGGVIIAAKTRSSFGGSNYNNGVWDYVILKLDSKGEQQWLKTYGGSESDIPTSIIERKDGGYVVVGYTYSEYVQGGFNKGDADAWIMSIYGEGDIFWSRVYGGSYTDIPKSVCETPDGDLIVGGFSTSNDGDVGYNGGDEDYWIMKLGDYGELVWSETHGEESIARLSSIKVTEDGGIIAAGMRYYEDDEGNYNETITDLWILKMQPAFASLKSDVSDSVFSISKRNMKSNIEYINMGEVSVNDRKDTTFTSALCNVTNDRVYINNIVMKDDIYNEFSVELLNGHDYLEVGECVDLKFNYKPKELGEKYVTVEFNTSSGLFRNAIYLRGISSTTVEKKYFTFKLIPNVSATNIHVSLYLEKQEFAKLEIYDTQGRKIEVLYSGIINEGLSEFNIILEEYNNGQYYLQLNTPTISKTEKFEVFK